MASRSFLSVCLSLYFDFIIELGSKKKKRLIVVWEGVAILLVQGNYTMYRGIPGVLLEALNTARGSTWVTT